jgi:hypothetical protein
VEHHDFTLVLKNSYVPSRHRAYSRVRVHYLGGPPRKPGNEVVEERCYSREELTRALGQEGLALLVEEDFAFSSAPEFGKLKTWWYFGQSRQILPHRLTGAHEPELFQ